MERGGGPKRHGEAPPLTRDDAPEDELEAAVEVPAAVSEGGRTRGGAGREGLRCEAPIRPELAARPWQGGCAREREAEVAARKAERDLEVRWSESCARFGLSSPRDRGKGAAHGKRSGGGCAEGGEGPEVRWSESCALRRRCAARELPPTLMAETVRSARRLRQKRRRWGPRPGVGGCPGARRALETPARLPSRSGQTSRRR